MEENMELFIAEKPSVGKAIAAAIGATESKNGYMEGHGSIVTWCLGHLIELAMPEDYNKDFATWRYKDLPIRTFARDSAPRAVLRISGYFLLFNLVVFPKKMFSLVYPTLCP